ncbi:cAMP-binding protein (plasmid) [Mycolicibacterium chubuense NBB4]|uniref:CRP-like cAMP-activated global transcriptional regulator n=1 Tax=Mycolicibacterium chubuense (strain NBB4) TaxID=710421 RepID=I4BSC8_MYCCN|nr:Crp/Fnr family transcriptional regulator [Mycolicibacterium chubuense]AFM20185.1 cAMP-binding protein [Mycolicibacterium chubuense NBB4]
MDKVLAGAAIAEAVHPAAAAALRRRLHPIVFGARQAVFTEGEPGDRLYIIKSGKVKIGRRFPRGRQHLLAILGPSDMFGELSVFDPGPRTSSATTITKVRAAWMDRDGLRAWIADRPEIAEQLLQTLARRLRRTTDTLAEHSGTDVPGRVARQLLLLAHRFGTGNGDTLRVTHELTQEEIAQLAGAGREATHKALHDFADRGWIRLETNAVVILHPDKLAHRAGHTGHIPEGSLHPCSEWC